MVSDLEGHLNEELKEESIDSLIGLFLHLNKIINDERIKKYIDDMASLMILHNVLEKHISSKINQNLFILLKRFKTIDEIANLKKLEQIKEILKD